MVRNPAIILTDGRYRVAVPAGANLAKIVRWMRVCGFSIRYRNGFILEPIGRRGWT